MEVVLLPLTYRVIGWVRGVEGLEASEVFPA